MFLAAAHAKPPPRVPRSLLANDAMTVQYDIVLSKEAKDQATLILAIVNKAAAPIINVTVTVASSANVAVVSLLSIARLDGPLIRFPGCEGSTC